MAFFHKLETWQWNQYVIVFTAFTVFNAFSFVNPFLSVYINTELGVLDLKEAAFWAGVGLAAAPLISSVVGPLWGMLADRFGYPVMIQRILLCFVFILGATAFVNQVWQLVALRLAIGFFGGFPSMSMALITSIAPRTQTGKAVGMLQGTRAFAQAVAPAVGGLLAVWIGMRQTFIVSAAFTLLAFLLMSFVYREDVALTQQARKERKTGSMRAVVRSPAFLAVALVLFLVQMVDQSFGPILPLFVTTLEGNATQATSWSGFIISAAAIATAISALGLGRVAMRYSPRKLLLGTLFGGMVLCVPMVFVQSAAQLLVLRVGLGLLAGGSVTLAFTLGGHVIPENLRGAGFGMLTSATLIGNAVSPLIAGTLATIVDLHYVFILNAALYATSWVWVWWVIGRTTKAERTVESAKQQA